MSRMKRLAVQQLDVSKDCLLYTSIRKAAREGANLALLPEMFTIMSNDPKDVLHAAERYQDGPVQKIMAGLAKSLGIWIAAGTIPLKSDDEHRVTNTMLVYDAFGQEAARYDKIHLFSYRCV